MERVAPHGRAERASQTRAFGVSRVYYVVHSVDDVHYARFAAMLQKRLTGAIDLSTFESCREG
jgi:hypothetical protein